MFGPFTKDGRIIYSGGSQNLERRNVELTNIKITKHELIDSFIFKFNFLLFLIYLHNFIIF